MQREEARQQRELTAKAEALRNEQAKRFAAEKDVNMAFLLLYYFLKSFSYLENFFLQILFSLFGKCKRENVSRLNTNTHLPLLFMRKNFRTLCEHPISS